MQEYNTLFKEFIQYKRFLGYKYKTDEIVLNEIKQYLIKNNISMITKEVTSNYATVNTNLSSNTPTVIVSPYLISSLIILSAIKVSMLCVTYLLIDLAA